MRTPPKALAEREDIEQDVVPARGFLRRLLWDIRNVPDPSSLVSPMAVTTAGPFMRRGLAKALDPASASPMPAALREAAEKSEVTARRAWNPFARPYAKQTGPQKFDISIPVGRGKAWKEELGHVGLDALYPSGTGAPFSAFYRKPAFEAALNELVQQRYTPGDFTQELAMAWARAQQGQPVFKRLVADPDWQRTARTLFQSAP